MSAETILLFLITDLLFCLMPGPVTMVTVAHVFSGGMKNAWGPIIGVNLGNFIWYGLSALGLITLAATAPTLYMALRYVGIVYLVWMGVSMIRADSVFARQPDRARRLPGRFFKGLCSGLAVHMSNPKALLFYTAFLPQFIDPDRPIAPQVLVFAILTIFTETFGLIFYSIIAAQTARLTIASGKAKYLSRISGTVLLLVAAAMLFINR